MQDGTAILHPELPPLTDEQLLEAARLVTVGGVAGDVAHELNNPLFAILGLVELLLKDPDLSPKTAQRLELIQRTGLDMKQIVRTLVDFARDPSTEPLVAELESIARRAVDIADRTGSARDVELVVQTTREPTAVECSPAYLVAALVELIGRTRRALPIGGTVTVAVGQFGMWAAVRIVASGEQIDLAALEAGPGLALAEVTIDSLGGRLVRGPGAELAIHLPPAADEYTA